MVKYITNTACRDIEAVLRQSKINYDNVDDADKRHLVGSLIINIDAIIKQLYRSTIDLIIH